MHHAVIIGTGMAVPDKELDNAWFNELLGEDVGTWLAENLHIYKRRWCAEDESVADLIEQASQQALANAGVTAEELDLIIVATDTPEYISPSTASVTQHRLGAKKAGTFDLNTACAGFVTALDVAAKYIQADNRYGNVLVVGGYAMSKHLNLKDKKTVTLFADGAGAIILQAQKDTDRGFLTSRLHTEGQYHDWMGIYGGGTFKPISDQVLAEHDHQLKFVHRFPKELNPKIWSEMALEMAEEIQVNPQDVSQYLVTQLNINGIWETMDKLQVPRERAHTVMQNFGYTGSACIPMALHDAVQKGKIKEGDLLFLIGSGGGLAFASAAVRF